MEDLRSLGIRLSLPVLGGGERGEALADQLRRHLYFANEKREVLEGASRVKDVAGCSSPSDALLSEPFPAFYGKDMTSSQW